MKSRIIRSILIVVLCAGFVAHAKKQTSSETRISQCVVNIDLNSEFMKLDPSAMDYLLKSPNVQGKAATEVLGVNPEKVVLKWGQIALDNDLSRGSYGIEIELSDEVKPAAEELLKALIENLRQELRKGYINYRQKLVVEIERIEERLQTIKKQIDEQEKQQKDPVEVNLEKYFTAEDLRTEERLKQKVDLSQFSPEMSFAEAVGIIRNSTDPPLKIFVNWRDLYDNADIDRGTPINIDPIPEIELGAGLKHLLEAVSGGFAELDYEIDNGVVAISTKESLPSDHVMVTYDVSGIGNADSLATLIIEAVEPDSWFEAGGEGTIAIYGNRLVIKQSKWTHRKIKELLQSIPSENLADTMEVNIKEIAQKEKLLEQKKAELDLLIHRIEAQRGAIEAQINTINQEVNAKIEQDTIILEIRRMIERLKRIESDDETTDLDVSEKMIQAQLQLAQRRQALVNEIGGDRLAELNEQLSEFAIELADKRASVGSINKQLQQVRSELSAAQTINPQKLKIKQAKKDLLKYEQKLAKLKSVLENSREPVVTTLGID